MVLLRMGGGSTAPLGLDFLTCKMGIIEWSLLRGLLRVLGINFCIEYLEKPDTSPMLVDTTTISRATVHLHEILGLWGHKLHVLLM